MRRPGFQPACRNAPSSVRFSAPLVHVGDAQAAPSPSLTRQVADRLGLSPATVLRRWRSGELPGFRIASNVLRFSEADVDAWLERRRRGGLEEDRATDSQEPAPR